MNQFRSPRHEQAYRLKHEQGHSYSAIGVKLGVTSQRAFQLVVGAFIQEKRRGPKIAEPGTHRLSINVRLPQQIIESIKRAADENGTSVTDEVEARLVETLVKDGILDRDTAIRFCGVFAANSLLVS